jgi:cytoskeletal protein CcmA (bactofilin family)
MSARDDHDSRAPIPVVVPAGARFEGLIAFRDDARIEGEVVGRISGTGRLEVGDEASISGPIEVAELLSSGHIEGDVEAGIRTELSEGATLSGTLRTKRLAVADGAVIQGRCRVGMTSE